MGVESAGHWSLADFANPEGRQIGRRFSRLSEVVQLASERGEWQYFRSHVGAVGCRSRVADEAGRTFDGINLASQDYLGLASDPRVHEAAIRAIRDLGVHSSGSAPLGGGLRSAQKLEESLKEVAGLKHALLFPTGWGAGYGAIRGVVREHDHVVLDALAHDCLKQGASASTRHLSVFPHNSPEGLRRRLRKIRGNFPDSAILVAFESLYSMDSDSPPVGELLAVCREFDAASLVDVAHDFGLLGPGGRGVTELTASYQDADVVVGSFSKVFATLGGFMLTNELAWKRAVQGFSGSYTFSNYLSPIQIACAGKAVEIVFGPEGDPLREGVLGKCRMLRRVLADGEVGTQGADSAMVIVPVGSEIVARRAYKSLLERGVITNCVEFPAVRKGRAIFRLQLTPRHDEQDLRSAGLVVSEVLEEFSSFGDANNANDRRI